MYLSKPNYASIAMNFADVVMGLICSENKYLSLHTDFVCMSNELWGLPTIATAVVYLF